MEILLPITTKSSLSLRTPVEIFRDAEKEIEISPFTIEEKEWFFDVNNLQIKPQGEEVSYSKGENPPNHYGGNFHDYIRADLKLRVGSTNENLSVFQGERDKLDFILRVVCGCSLSLFRVRSPGTIFHNSTSFVTQDTQSRRSHLIIDEDIVRKVKKLFPLLDFGDPTITLVRFYLLAAMASLQTHLSGAFYVSILERILAPENASGAGYRLALRLAKLRKKDLLYVSELKRLYRERNNAFHGKRGNFSIEDVAFLEEEVAWVIEEFIRGRSFDPKQLDAMLLE